MAFDPELQEAITISKKGRRELRGLVSRGRFALIEYLDPETKERVEDKVKLVLLHDDGRVDEIFLIPTKTPGRRLVIEPKEKKGTKIKVWNRKTGKVEELFPP